MLWARVGLCVGRSLQDLGPLPQSSLVQVILTGWIQALELTASLADTEILAKIWRVAENGLTPHGLRVIAHAETADGRSRYVEGAMCHSVPLEVSAVLVQGGRKSKANQRKDEQRDERQPG